MRPERLRAAGALAVCLLVITACGDDGVLGGGGGSDETLPPAADNQAVTGEFVGAADSDVYVAFHATPGAAAGESQVVAYVCNRQVGLPVPSQLAEWFTGTAIANTVELTSQSGKTKLEAKLEPNRVRGTVRLPEGKSLGFEATSTIGPRTAAAGLYDFSLNERGILIATSRGGKGMALTPIERDGQPGYAGDITLPNGERLGFELFVKAGVLTNEELAKLGAARAIILPDGTIRGVFDPIPGKSRTVIR